MSFAAATTDEQQNVAVYDDDELPNMATPCALGGFPNDGR
jgi:hypothetical protein